MTCLTVSLDAAVTPDDGARTTHVPVHIMWSDADPLAVSFLFTEADGTETVWEIGRDLLMAGARSLDLVGDEHAGCAQVRAAGFCLALVLQSSQGRVYVMIPRRPVDELLRESIRACPPGSSRERAAVQADLGLELAELLRGAAS